MPGNNKFLVLLLFLICASSQVQSSTRRASSATTRVLQSPSPQYYGKELDTYWDYNNNINNLNSLNKQDYDGTPVNTQFVVNYVFRILGTLATFTVFILQPIFYSILNASGVPIPILRRSFNEESSSFTNSSRTAEFGTARGILDKDRCIERISCDLANYSKGKSFMRRFATTVVPWFSTQENGITSRIMKTLAKQSDQCVEYTCDPLGFLIRLFIYKIDWNTLLKT